MKLNPRFLLVLASLALLCTFGLAQAGTDFRSSSFHEMTMLVPVKLSNYGGKWAVVWCEIRDASSHGLAAAYNNVEGLSNDGSVNTTVQVRVSLPLAKTGIARSWRCVLSPDSPSGSPPTSIPGGITTMAEVSGNF